MSSKKLNPFKDFQSDQIQRSSRKIFNAHYAWRNAALNLTPVTGTANGFIFQIINSLIESWGVRLTWFDCNRVGVFQIELEPLGARERTSNNLKPHMASTPGFIGGRRVLTPLRHPCLLIRLVILVILLWPLDAWTNPY